MSALRPRTLSILVTVIGCVVVIGSALLSSASATSQAIISIGAVLPMLGLFFCRDDRTQRLANTLSMESAVRNLPVTDDRKEFDEWREHVCQSLEQQSLQLDQQRQRFNDRTLRYREFLEYPEEDLSIDSQELSETELSGCDRQVNQFLEQEAARVYEKLRVDGYRVNGQLDAAMIRQEAFDIIQRVAQIYSPQSENPLLETSFDQLARAASRLCLQILVLVEQLPLNVQHYTIAELYDYVRKAVSAWGTWQTVSPWMTRMSHGLYAGRLAASSNPVTLGAWWLATELGRRGTKKLVENYVDQRAVAFFNDAVRLIGNEVACVYGPGIRQRDPAWAYGAELTELHYRFPPSQDSLQACLREVTSLPLRSEYDRIYLYRCLAEHKPSGLRLADPTVLTRNERERIAERLEHFFQSHTHGARESDVEKWRRSVEEHLDLKLSLNSRESDAITPQGTDEALRSIHSFLTGAGGLAPTEAFNTLQSGQLFEQLTATECQSLQKELTTGETPVFEPPNLDPNDPLTSDFMDELIGSCVRAQLFAPSIEALLLETGRYFRRGAEEIRRSLTDAWMQQLRTRTLPDAPMPRKSSVPARQLLQLLEPGESIAAVYHEIELKSGSGRKELDAIELRLAVLRRSGQRRLLLMTTSPEAKIVWESQDEFQTERLAGLVSDDCKIAGGQWCKSEYAATLILSGRFGTRYEIWFAPLLDL